ncbi:hypothetical protein Q3G72_013112 [Acer saccharum]|nr:hypothetical protein Q3G72_013112 [Acer saccharum]
MGRFVALYKASPMLQEMLRNPVLKQQRVAALDAVLARLEVGPIVHKLLALLAARDRMHWLQDVSEQIEALADKQIGRLRAKVTAAVMPTQAQTQRIAETLERRLGKSVLVTVTAEPSLLAGLVCQVGDLTFDSSLSRQLAILTERLGAHGAS